MLINPVTYGFAKDFLNQPGAPFAIIGPEGVGKIYVAKFLGSELLKAKSIFDHPYIFYIDATNAGIEEIRELQKNLRLKVPGQNKIRRLVIINNYEKFGREAQNSLLKLIEEPPLDTQVIILINNTNFVLPTILSRVQILNVLPVSLEQSIQYFSTKNTMSEINKAHIISGGHAELMQNILDNDDSNLLLKYIDMAKRILSSDKYIRIGEIDKLLKDKDLDLPLLIDSIIKVLSATYKQSLNNPKATRANLNRLYFATKCTEEVSIGVNKKLALTQFLSKI